MNIFAANKRLREAREALKTADAALARALTQEDQAKRSAEVATAAEVDCDMADALARASERRDAETIASAASRNVAAGRRTQSAAKAELQAAEYAARQTAYAVIVTESEDLADQVARAEASLQAMRDRLCAVRNLPNFPISAKIARAIGDDLHTPLSDIQPRGDLATPRNLIGVVTSSAAALATWEQRVSQLLLSDGVSAACETAAA